MLTVLRASESLPFPSTTLHLVQPASRRPITTSSVVLRGAHAPCPYVRGGSAASGAGGSYFAATDETAAERWHTATTIARERKVQETHTYKKKTEPFTAGASESISALRTKHENTDETHKNFKKKIHQSKSQKNIKL